MLQCVYHPSLFLPIAKKTAFAEQPNAKAHPRQRPAQPNAEQNITQAAGVGCSALLDRWLTRLVQQIGLVVLLRRFRLLNDLIASARDIVEQHALAKS